MFTQLFEYLFWGFLFFFNRTSHNQSTSLTVSRKKPCFIPQIICKKITTKMENFVLGDIQSWSTEFQLSNGRICCLIVASHLAWIGFCWRSKEKPIEEQNLPRRVKVNSKRGFILAKEEVLNLLNEVWIGGS